MFFQISVQWVPNFCASPFSGVDSVKTVWSHLKETWPSKFFVTQYNFSLFPFIVHAPLSSQDIFPIA